MAGMLAQSPEGLPSTAGQIVEPEAGVPPFQQGQPNIRPDDFAMLDALRTALQQIGIQQELGGGAPRNPFAGHTPEELERLRQDLMQRGRALHGEVMMQPPPAAQLAPEGPQPRNPLLDLFLGFNQGV